HGSVERLAVEQAHGAARVAGRAGDDAADLDQHVLEHHGDERLVLNQENAATFEHGGPPPHDVDAIAFVPPLQAWLGGVGSPLGECAGHRISLHTTFDSCMLTPAALQIYRRRGGWRSRRGQPVERVPASKGGSRCSTLTDWRRALCSSLPCWPPRPARRPCCA